MRSHCRPHRTWLQSGGNSGAGGGPAGATGQAGAALLAGLAAVQALLLPACEAGKGAVIYGRGVGNMPPANYS